MHKLWSKTKIRNFLSCLKYEPTKYWQKRGEVFYSEDPYDNTKFRQQEKAFLDYISKLDFSTVLEVGCGFGRMTKLVLNEFPNIVNYDAIDISKHQIENAKKHVQSDKVKFQQSTIQDFKPQKKYDIVFSTYVLMHVKPDEISPVITKLVGLSNKFVINVDWYQEPKPIIHEGHNFVHDYEKLYQTNPEVETVDKIRVPIEKPRTILFSAKINQNPN